MASVRIRWRGVARAAAILVVALIALRVVPGLLRAPEPPPLGRDVGLPRGRPAPIEPVREAMTPKPHEKKRKKKKKKKARVVPDRAASTAVIGTHHQRRIRPRRPVAKPAPEPIETTPPPVPEYVPPPSSELPAVPSPAPATTPGDGSQEFAPH
jgi:hypothetical protein